MPYVNEGIDQRAEVLIGKADTLTLVVKAGGQLLTGINSAKVTIMEPSGVVIVAQVNAVVTGSILSYTRTWDTGDTKKFELWEDFVAEWEYVTVNGTYTDRQFFDVVRTKLPCLIDVNNLLDYYPDLIQHLAAIEETDADKFCRRAWSLMLDRIRSGKNRPSLILDRSRLVNPGVQKALELVCNALSRDIGDIWSKRKADHKAEYEALRAGLGELKYDRDEDGLAADTDIKRINRRRFSV